MNPRPLPEQVAVEDGHDEAQDHGELPRGHEATGLVRFVAGVPVDVALLHVGLVLVNQLADEVLRHQLLGVEAVSHVLEVLGGVLAGDVDQHLVAAGVVVQELGDVVDEVVHDEHRVRLRVALRELFTRESLGRHCAASLSPGG